MNKKNQGLGPFRVQGEKLVKEERKIKMQKEIENKKFERLQTMYNNYEEFILEDNDINVDLNSKPEEFNQVKKESFGESKDFIMKKKNQGLGPFRTREKTIKQRMKIQDQKDIEGKKVEKLKTMYQEYENLVFNNDENAADL